MLNVREGDVATAKLKANIEHNKNNNGMDGDDNVMESSKDSSGESAWNRTEK